VANSSHELSEVAVLHGEAVVSNSQVWPRSGARLELVGPYCRPVWSSEEPLPPPSLREIVFE